MELIVLIVHPTLHENKNFFSDNYEKYSIYGICHHADCESMIRFRLWLKEDANVGGRQGGLGTCCFSVCMYRPSQGARFSREGCITRSWTFWWWMVSRICCREARMVSSLVCRNTTTGKLLKVEDTIDSHCVSNQIEVFTLTWFIISVAIPGPFDIVIFMQTGFRVQFCKL